MNGLYTIQPAIECLCTHCTHSTHTSFALVLRKSLEFHHLHQTNVIIYDCVLCAPYYLPLVHIQRLR